MARLRQRVVARQEEVVRAGDDARFHAPVHVLLEHRVDVIVALTGFDEGEAYSAGCALSASRSNPGGG